MIAYALRRLLWTAPVLFGVTLILFALLHVLPGDPARVLTGDRNPSPQALANIKDRLEINAPLYRQYINYLTDLAHGDLGVSFRTQRPVAVIIAETLPNSLKLALAALALEAIMGLTIGVLAALGKRSIFDSAVLAVTSLLAAMPVFVLGLAMQLLVGLRLGWLPVAGIGDGGPVNYILPALVMATIGAAGLIRVVRSGLLDVLSQDYITAARANGLSELRVIGIHALRNALPPAITVLGLHLGLFIGTAVATEAVFDWPGIGHRLYSAVLERDRAVVIGATLALTVIFVLVNLFVDLINAWLNPRLRSESLPVENHG